jgi:hypothetical protein
MDRRAGHNRGCHPIQSLNANQQASHLKPTAVSLQHGSQSSSNASAIELHLFVGTEGLEDGLPLRFGEPSQIEFVVIAQKLTPLRGGRARSCIVHRFHQGSAIAGCQRIEQMLIHIKVEGHLQAFAGLAEIFHIVFRRDVGLAQNDRAAFSPRQEL